MPNMKRRALRPSNNSFTSLNGNKRLEDTDQDAFQAKKCGAFKKYLLVSFLIFLISYSTYTILFCYRIGASEIEHSQINCSLKKISLDFEWFKKKMVDISKLNVEIETGLTKPTFGGLNVAKICFHYNSSFPGSGTLAQYTPNYRTESSFCYLLASSASDKCWSFEEYFVLQYSLTKSSFSYSLASSSSDKRLSFKGITKCYLYLKELHFVLDNNELRMCFRFVLEEY